MSTKNNPGNFNCYDKAEPDEPMFILLGRDPTAGVVVSFWRALREELGQDCTDDQLVDAAKCANELEAYAKSLGKDVDLVVNALIRVVIKAYNNIEETKKNISAEPKLTIS